jgi:hypothetical protein
VHFCSELRVIQCLFVAHLAAFQCLREYNKGLEDRGIVVRILAGEEACFLFKIDRPFLTPTQSPSYWAHPALLPGVQRPLIPSSAEVKREQNDTSSAPNAFAACTAALWNVLI